MSIVINLLLFILILGFIVFVHEAGHFIFAKMNGVYVYEFSIGMGPILFKKQGKETLYSIRVIPIGGFCQLAGEDLGEDDKNKVPKEKRLQNKAPWQRFLIMFFGAGNNFISAFLILLLIGSIWGASSLRPIINYVDPNSASYNAGLRSGDLIKEIDDKKIDTSDDITLNLALSKHKKPTKFLVIRDNGKSAALVFVSPHKTKNGYVYGIGVGEKGGSGLVNGFRYANLKFKSIYKQMYVTIGSLVNGDVKFTDLSGPVGIYSVVGQQRKAGFVNILYLVAFLSINVGFMNLLPLPAMDGGHIIFIFIEMIVGHPVNSDVENKIHFVGLLILFTLMIFVTVMDIVKIFM